MTTDLALARLGRLVAASHSWETARTFKAYVPSEDDKAVMAARAQDVLKVMAGKDVTAPMLNAAYAVHLARALPAPIVVAEGVLSVAGTPVAEDHGWVMIGPWLADMALFSRAYAPDAPPRLAAHVLRAFGPNKGLFCEAWRRTPRLGLGYEPRRVLAEADVTALVGEATEVLRGVA
ncbi:hypothetical protein [Novosphingobium sp. SG720]|uniref:hypothetical protein n=1 Tax=Novosphingobium sp. SG720 TaxID=2586998 RepID=UPI001445C72F|nr:hypothetical protein [Novosphingobium sp. SG720]NKJ43363.1 hypothetical protein [Novosphingobium sp. SG720]